MKAAICLYGQPRDYMTGFKHLSELVRNNTHIQFDFFFHTWTLEGDEVYPFAHWRNISIDSVRYDKDIKEKLLELYKPILHTFQNQIKTFDKNIYIDTIAYKNSLNYDGRLKNIDNVLSQMYSRNMVRNLLLENINKTHITYSTVIFTRFDYNCEIPINLTSLDLSYLYCANIEPSRSYFPDNFLIIPQEIFLKLFDIFDSLHELFNDPELDRIIPLFKEYYIINAEDIIFAKYIVCFKNLDRIKHTDLIQMFK